VKCHKISCQCSHESSRGGDATIKGCSSSTQQMHPKMAFKMPSCSAKLHSSSSSDRHSSSKCSLTGCRCVQLSCTAAGCRSAPRSNSGCLSPGRAVSLAPPPAWPPQTGAQTSPYLGAARRGDA